MNRLKMEINELYEIKYKGGVAKATFVQFDPESNGKGIFRLEEPLETKVENGMITTHPIGSLLHIKFRNVYRYDEDRVKNRRKIHTTTVDFIPTEDSVVHEVTLNNKRKMQSTIDTPFTRENRYIVIKRDDLQYLSGYQNTELKKILENIALARYQDNKVVHPAFVCINQEWDNGKLYEAAWKLIEEYVKSQEPKLYPYESYQISIHETNIHGVNLVTCECDEIPGLKTYHPEEEAAITKMHNEIAMFGRECQKAGVDMPEPKDYRLNPDNF